jgi:hypothetical protein
MFISLVHAFRHFVTAPGILIHLIFDAAIGTRDLVVPPAHLTSAHICASLIVRVRYSRCLHTKLLSTTPGLFFQPRSFARRRRAGKTEIDFNRLFGVQRSPLPFPDALGVGRGVVDRRALYPRHIALYHNINYKGCFIETNVFIFNHRLT